MFRSRSFVLSHKVSLTDCRNNVGPLVVFALLCVDFIMQCSAKRLIADAG